MSVNIVYNRDCLEAMKEMPDNAFDLAIVDPPYGGGASDAAERERERERETGLRSEIKVNHADVNTNATTGRFARYKRQGGGFGGDIKAERTGGTWAAKYSGIKVHRQNSGGGNWKEYPYGCDIRHWDIAPTEEYFNELARVSKNQVIWGGNYFALPPTRCFLIWEKLSISESFSMAMCEYAWTSFNENAKSFKCAPQGAKDDPRFHPCCKPIALYTWILNKFAKEGDKILDTHLGSGSSRIAAYLKGLDFVGFEIDPDYFRLQEERFEKYTQQQTMF